LYDKIISGIENRALYEEKVRSANASFTSMLRTLLKIYHMRRVSEAGKREVRITTEYKLDKLVRVG